MNLVREEQQFAYNKDDDIHFLISQIWLYQSQVLDGEMVKCY